jgi:hypothetical protein
MPVDLDKRLEDAIYLTDRNADARVGDTNPQHADVAIAGNGHGPSNGRELDGIDDQVEQNLLESLRVGRDADITVARGDSESETLCLGLQHAESFDLAEHVIDIEGNQVQWSRALEPRDG